MNEKEITSQRDRKMDYCNIHCIAPQYPFFHYFLTLSRYFVRSCLRVLYVINFLFSIDTIIPLTVISNSYFLFLYWLAEAERVRAAIRVQGSR